MDIEKLFLGVDCACGKLHLCDIEHVYIENGAISRLSSLTEGKKNVLLVADENTYRAAGKKTEKALAGKVIGKIIFEASGVLIPDENAIERVQKSLFGIELIIGIGSGVIQDLCKFVSFYSKIPYMIVATAPSMDGYASDGAAMILGGMKKTVKAGLPRAIIADTEVLKDAPMEMIKAGYGDIIGKYSALCDWKLSTAVNGEYFCDYVYNVTREMIENVRKNAEGILARDEESIGALMKALIVVGVMMSFAGSSRPASGSEHHLSHFFEIVGIINNSPYFSHGIDVAYSTVITSKLREELIKSSFPDRIFRLSRKDYEEKMQKIYKSVASGCIRLQDKTGNYEIERLSRYKEKEKEIKKILAECPTTKEIEEILAVVGLDTNEFFDLYGKEKVNCAISYAKDLKDRYTVLWLYYDFFGEKTDA